MIILEPRERTVRAEVVPPLGGGVHHLLAVARPGPHLAPGWRLRYRISQALRQAQLAYPSVRLFAGQTTRGALELLLGADTETAASFAHFTRVEVAERLQRPRLWSGPVISEAIDPALATVHTLADILARPVAAGEIRSARLYGGFGTLRATLRPLTLFGVEPEDGDVRIEQLPRYASLSGGEYADLVERQVELLELELLRERAA